MQRRIGIYFFSKYGQTEKISHCLSQWLTDFDCEVHTRSIREVRRQANFNNVDAILIGSPIYMRRYPSRVREFIRQNRDSLLRIPVSGFFSVSLSATPDTPKANRESLVPLRKLLDEVAWTPQWIASFPGALSYREYSSLLRWLMQRISRKAGGPTDTGYDHELTRWNDVWRFGVDFVEDERNSPYRSESLALATRTLNEIMPEFEHRIVQEQVIAATPEEVRAGIESMQRGDMPLGELLARVRNFGRRGGPEVITFAQAASAFGAVPVLTKQPHEIIGGLIGQFWKRDYGIRPMRNSDEFVSFSDQGYAKALTNFWFDDCHNGMTVLRTETRIHSLGDGARQRFRWYWNAVAVGIRLCMASVLRGVSRSIARQRARRHALAH